MVACKRILLAGHSFVDLNNDACEETFIDKRQLNRHVKEHDIK